MECVLLLLLLLLLLPRRSSPVSTACITRPWLLSTTVDIVQAPAAAETAVSSVKPAAIAGRIGW
jgi:hypothetical protein